MSLRPMKALIAPIGLLILLTACQSGGPYRSYGQPVAYSRGYDPCTTSSYGCDQRAGVLTSGRFCPPGYRLTRLSYREYGGSARGCVLVRTRQTYRYASAPRGYRTDRRGYAAEPCYCGRQYRAVRSEPIRRGGCCR